MSFGTLELLVEINQSKANSSAKSVATSMSDIIKASLKDSTKDVFSSFVGDSKSASDGVKANLSSLLSIVTVLKKDLSSVFTPQSLKVTLETKDLQDRLKAIQDQKKALESKTVIEIKADITQAKTSIDSLHKSLEVLKAVKTINVHVDTTKALKSVEALDKALKNLSKKGSIEVKANIEKALGSVQLINKDLDRIATRENLVLNLNDQQAKTDIEQVIRELDRASSKDNIQLKIKADKALKEIDLVQKELDRVATERNVVLKIEARTAENELKRVQKLEDDLQRDIKIQISLDDKRAKEDARDLQGIRDALAKDAQIRVTANITQAENEFKHLSQQLRDLRETNNTITVKKLETNIDSGKVRGVYTSGLEKELALVKEIQRYKSELSKVEKLTLSTEDLERARKELHDIHKIANETIHVKFGEARGLDKLKSEVKEAVSDIKSNFSGLTQGIMQGVGQQAFQSFTEGIRGVVGVVSGSIEVMGNFEEKINQFAAFNGSATTVDVKALADEAKRLGEVTSTTAIDAGEAAVQLTKVGLNATQTKDQLEGVVKLAEGSGLKDMGKAAQVAGTAFSIFGQDTKRTADMVAATVSNIGGNAEDFLQLFSKAGGIAKSTGQDIDGLATMFGLLRRNGFQAEAAAGQLKAGLLKLSAPTAEGKKALETLGISVFDSSGKMKQMLPLLEEFKSKLSGFDDQSKMGLSKKIFGAGGSSGFLSMMTESSSKVGELFGKVKNSNGASDEASKKLLTGLPGALKQLKGTVENLQINFGEAVAPGLEAIVRLANEVAAKLGKGDIFAAIKSGAMEFAAYLTDNKKLVTDIVLGVQQLANAMGTQLTKSAKDFTDYMKSNPDAMKTMIADLGNLAVNLGLLVLAVFDFGKGFTEAAMSMSSMIEPMATMFANLTGSSGSSAGLAENLGKAAAYLIPLLALGSLVEIITTISAGVSAIVSLFGGWAVIGATVSGIIVEIGSILAATAVTIGGLVAGTITFAEVWAVVLGAINPIALAVVAIGATIYTITTYTQNWDAVVLGVKQTIEDTKNVFKDFIRWIVNGIGQSENFENVWKVIKELIIAITTPFGLITKIIDMGVEKTGLFKNEWEYIKGLANGVGDAFKSVVGGALNFLIEKAGQLANTLKGMMGMGSGNGGATGIGGTAAFEGGYSVEGEHEAHHGGNSYHSEGDGETHVANGMVVKDLNLSKNGNYNVAVPSAASGTARLTPDAESGGYGNLVEILDKQGNILSQMAHLASFAPGLQSGQQVDRMQNIGIQGTTGHSTGIHLHVTLPAAEMKAYLSDLKSGTKAVSGAGIGANSGVASGAMSLAGSFPGGSGGGGSANDYITALTYLKEGQGANIALENRAKANYGGNGTTMASQALAKGQFAAFEEYQGSNQFDTKEGVIAAAQKYGFSESQLKNAGNQAYQNYGQDSKAVGRRTSFRTTGSFDGSNSVEYKGNSYLNEETWDGVDRQTGGSKSGGHTQDDGHNHGGNNAAASEANDEINGLRSTVKEEEAAKAEKEADKLAKQQEALDRKHQKAIETVNKMQDQGVTQQRKREKESRQIDKDERIQAIDRELATTTNSDVKATLENTKKKINIGSSESEKIVEDENRVADLGKLKDRKLKDLKSPLAEVKEKAQQEPDYSQAIKDQNILLDSRRKLRNEMEVTASLEFDTANKTKNEDLEKVTRIQTTTEAYNKEKRMLEELKTHQETEDPTAVKKTEFLIKRLDLQHASSIALIEEESKLKKATEARDAYNKTLEKIGGKPDDTLKRLDTEIDNITNKVKDINADKNSKLKVIDLDEIKNAKELAKALDEVKASKEGVQSSSKTNLAKAKAGVLRKDGDEFGANAIERDAAKQEQTIKNRDRLRGVDKEIEDKSKTALPYSVKEIQDLKTEANELNKIEFSQAGSQFKTLGETIGTTFRDSVGSALKDVLTGAKSMGQAFQDVVSNMLSKLAELAVNSLLKDLMGGMFSGGGGGGGGMLGGLFGGLFGGGHSEGGMVPNFADGNLSTIGSNRPYLAGEPFRAAKNSPIAKALQREGSGGVVSVLKANELVLNPSQTKAFFAMGMDSQLSGSVNNYAEGNLSSFGGSVSTSSSSDNVTIPITINMSGNDDKDKSGLNIPKLQDEVRKTVIAEIQSQQRNGGGLSKG